MLLNQPQRKGVFDLSTWKAWTSYFMEWVSLSLHAVLVYFQMNYGLLLYLKLARLDVGNVSKKG